MNVSLNLTKSYGCNNLPMSGQVITPHSTLLDDTNPSPEQMLGYHRRCLAPVAGQFHGLYSRYQQLKFIWNQHSYNSLFIFQGHLSLAKMTAVLLTTVSKTFLEIWKQEFRIKFHWSLFLTAQLTAIMSSQQQTPTCHYVKIASLVFIRFQMMQRRSRWYKEVTVLLQGRRLHVNTKDKE